MFMKTPILTSNMFQTGWNHQLVDFGQLFWRPAINRGIWPKNSPKIQKIWLPRKLTNLPWKTNGCVWWNFLLKRSMFWGTSGIIFGGSGGNGGSLHFEEWTAVRLPVVAHSKYVKQNLSHEKKLEKRIEISTSLCHIFQSFQPVSLIFHYTGWLIGILIMGYYNPHIIG